MLDLILSPCDYANVHLSERSTFYKAGAEITQQQQKTFHVALANAPKYQKIKALLLQCYPKEREVLCKVCAVQYKLASSAVWQVVSLCEA